MMGLCLRDSGAKEGYLGHWKLRDSSRMTPPHSAAGRLAPGGAKPPGAGVFRGYRCVVVDPPWPMKRSGKRESRPKQGPLLDYDTLPLEAINGLPVSHLCADDATVFLWATHSFLESALSTLHSWGFRYGRCLTWDKGNGMVFQGFHHRTEFCLVGTIGRVEFFRKGKAFPTVFTGRSHRHSQKPDEFYALVEQYSDGPYIDLFARQERPGWDVWGDEVMSPELPSFPGAGVFRGLL